MKKSTAYPWELAVHLSQESESSKCVICKGSVYREESVVLDADGLCPYCAEARQTALLNRKTRELFK